MFHFRPKNRQIKQRRTRKFESLERRDLMAADLIEAHQFTTVGPQIEVCSIAGEICQSDVLGYPQSSWEAAENVASTPGVLLNAVPPDDSFSNPRDLGTLHGRQSLSDSIGWTDTADYYRFTLDDTANIELRLDHLTADIDLYLYNEDGSEIARSWLGGNASERIELWLGSGSYYALVTPWGGAKSKYRLSLEADGAGDSPATARDLGVVEGVVEIHDWAGPQDANDYFRFVLDEPADVTLRVAQLTSDIDLYLYDEFGNEIQRSWQGGNSDEQIQLELEAGTYFVDVAPWGSAESNYIFSLDVDAAGDDFDSARDLGIVEGVRQVSDWVGSQDARDYFQFALDEQADVTLRLQQLSQDLDLYLYDADGNEVSRSWFGSNTDELIQLNLAAGNYFVLVTPWATAQSRYALTLDVDPDDDDRGDDDQQPLPDVPYFGGANDWNINAVNAPEAWAQGYTGTNVIVAVIDTGVDFHHIELADNIWTNDDIAGNGIDDDGNGYIDDYYGWDFAYGDNNPMDTHGHGTHVAGTIAAANNGVGATGIAFGALIMPVQVLGHDGSGTWDAVASGIRYAVDNGADIINLSLGGGYSTAIFSALAYANQRGVFVAAAAGNDSASTPGYPAHHSRQLGNVLSVGAHDASDWLAWFSNRVGNSGAVQIDAPGEGVFSTLPGNSYDSWSGTSMATPHVAGVAALVLGANPNLTPAQLRELLVDGATRSISGSDSAGGLNAGMSIAMALNTAAETYGVDYFATSTSVLPAANVNSIYALDSLFQTDLNVMPSRGTSIPSVTPQAQMLSTPNAAENMLLAMNASQSSRSITPSLEVAAVDAAFESLWDDREVELTNLQLV